MNRVLQVSGRNDQIQAYLQENEEWVNWQSNVLQERNAVENVYRWECGRPNALQDKMRDSDDDELHERDYDVASLANNFSNSFRYNIYENDDADEIQGFHDHDEEVAISSLRLGDDNQERSCLFTNSDWFAFREDRFSECLSTPRNDEDDDHNDGNYARDGADSSDEDEVVVGDVDGIIDPTESKPRWNQVNREDPTSSSMEEEVGVFGFEAQTTTGDDLFDDQQLPDWVGWHQPSDILLDGSGSTVDPHVDDHDHDDDKADNHDHHGVGPSPKEVEATPMAGGEGARLLDFGETSYWRVEQEAGLVVNE